MKSNDATRATAEAMPEINRRRFLLNTATAGAALAVAVPAVPAVADEPEMTSREQAIWHLRELERLVREDGGWDTAIMAIAKYANHQDCRMIGIRPSGCLTRDDNMFALEGDAA
ncbi:twin-arginine translocation signal domain-containing protein [Mesorhizobium sp. A556]